MSRSLRDWTAFAVAGVFVLSHLCVVREVVLAAGVTTSPGLIGRAASAAQRPLIGLTGSNRPLRVAIPEPPRRTPPPLVPASAFHPVMGQRVRASGRKVDSPAMLRPTEIDQVIVLARAKAKQRSLQRASSPQPQSQPRMVPGRVRGIGEPVKAHGRATQSMQGASGTGINPWWRYQEENVPGGGHVMVNVGSGNMVLQEDDMSVPHKGIAMAFRRTYNSQSLHDNAGSDGSPPSLYGNGWTNTFDAHVVAAPGQASIYDVDGARYDYVTTDLNSGYTSVTPGQHATLTWDGGCGLLWTKKTGTTYYFYSDAAPGCAGLGSRIGHLYQIIGRNRNTCLTFSYAWDTAGPTIGQISTIWVQAESGMTATLWFSDFGGRRLLYRLLFPDGGTDVYYDYDAQGNLSTVYPPANNAAGTRPAHGYGYQPLGSGTVMYWAASARWTNNWNGADGGYLVFSFAGASPASSTLTTIGHIANVNGPVADGTASGALQSGYPTAPYDWLDEYYTTGVAMPTFRDTAGHATNWVLDTGGRMTVTQTQECTAAVNQACTGSYLTTNETWDANNNLVSEVGPRGGETDYAYDPDGNTVEVAAPAPSQGAFRPTSLYSYDAHDNVVAFCDPNATHALQADWTSPPAAPLPGQGGLCPTQSTSAARYQWSFPSNEPYGELTASTSPGTPAATNGYQRTYAYNPGPQGGADFGLPTSVAGAAIAQNDPSTPLRQPQQSFWYDANGNLVCYGTGSGEWLLSYDALARQISIADPDDSSSGSGACGKTNGQPNWNTTTRTTYFADGAVASKQTASQVANGISTAFAYDLDGNEVSETHHYGCVAVSGCTAGVTQKFYDGADRLVEVSLPYDAYDIQGYPMMTRYIYDLSQGGTTPYLGLSLTGYGNLVKTQELLSGTVITPFTYATASSFGQYPLSSGTWTDVRATSFDGLDRALSSYEAAFGSQPKLTNAYDGAPPAGGAAELGLLSSVTLATNEVKQYTYDGVGHLTDTTYVNDNGATSPVHVRYDAAGHIVSRGTDALGMETLQYDAAGELKSIAKPASLGSATISYDYYPDGTRKDLNFASPAYTASALYQYAYRADGRRSSLTLNNGSAFTWSYTRAGRLKSQTDPFTGRTIAPDNYYTIGKSSTQHPYYPASVTYGPETYSFDNYGRTTGITLPAGVFSQTVSGFDLEDGITGMTGLSVQAPTSVTTTTCATSNVRNEKLPTYQGGCAGRLYNGATFALQQGAAAGDPGVAVAPWTLDARAGMLKSWQGPTQSSGNASSGQFSYDASGRLTADVEQLDRPWRASDGTMPGNRVYSTGTRTKTYDAENRLRSQQTSSATGATYPLWGENNPGGYFDDVGQGSLFELQTVDYSADSHPVRFTATYPPGSGLPQLPQTLTWLWDGNDVLAQCGYDNTKTQCSSYGFPVEGLGIYYPSNGYIVVQDRGLSGQIVASHGAVGFSGMKPVGRNARNYFFGGVNASAAPGSVSPDTGAAQQPGPNAMVTGTKVALDGWTLDNNTWQGVRTYDASVGQWNTPDAYAGDVHDPMSQKPFMWNHNNPYAYSDPSGYDYNEAGHDALDLARFTVRSPFAGMLTTLLIALSRSAGSASEDADISVDHAARADSQRPSDAVIGKYPQYTAAAKALQLHHFHVPSKIWNDWASGRQLSANKAWIEKGVQRRWIFLVVATEEERRTGGLAYEINLLLKSGYNWNSDHSQLIPPQPR